MVLVAHVPRRFETEPSEYAFCPIDQADSRTKAWHMPLDIVRGGELATLTPSAAVTLAAAAIHVWPDKGEQGPFTEWWTIPQRRLARLTGVSRNTITKNLEELQRAGWIEYMARPAGNSPTTAGCLRIHRRAYPRVFDGVSEPFARVPATLFYGGMMAVLPSPVIRRFVLVALAAVHIQDEQKYLGRCMFTEDGLTDDQRIALGSSETTWTHDELARLCGNGLSTLRPHRHLVVRERESGLRFPHPLVIECRWGPEFYFRRNAAALAHQFSPDELNEVGGVERIRAEIVASREKVKRRESPKARLLRGWRKEERASNAAASLDDPVAEKGEW